MNPVIRAQVRDFSRSHTLNAHNLETQFEIYSIFSILSGYLGENIDPYDVHLPGNEFGLDGVAVLIQGDSIKNEDEAKARLKSVNNPHIEFIFSNRKHQQDMITGIYQSFSMQLRAVLILVSRAKVAILTN